MAIELIPEQILQTYIYMELNPIVLKSKDYKEQWMIATLIIYTLMISYMHILQSRPLIIVK
jgi:hypothetical protein